MKLYRFGDYVIRVYENNDELEKTQLDGFRSMCPNKIGKPVGIEIIGDGFKRVAKEWSFCHLINSIEHVYKLILEEIK
jgi:hypothetical protein